MNSLALTTRVLVGGGFWNNIILWFSFLLCAAGGNPRARTNQIPVKAGRGKATSTPMGNCGGEVWMCKLSMFGFWNMNFERKTQIMKLITMLKLGKVTKSMGWEWLVNPVGKLWQLVDSLNKLNTQEKMQLFIWCFGSFGFIAKFVLTVIKI